MLKLSTSSSAASRISSFLHTAHGTNFPISDQGRLGHTNNKEYLRWMEEAALAHSDSLGWTMGRYLKIGKVFVASTHKIEYLRPTFEGDELTMLTWVETMDGSKSRRCFYLKRDNKVCMQGWTEWTFVDLQTGRAANISGEVKNDFPLVPADDPELKASGVRRSPSQS